MSPPLPAYCQASLHACHLFSTLFMYYFSIACPLPAPTHTPSVRQWRGVDGVGGSEFGFLLHYTPALCTSSLYHMPALLLLPLPFCHDMYLCIYCPTAMPAACLPLLMPCLCTALHALPPTHTACLLHGSACDVASYIQRIY